ncbi:MAG TPA: respiratory nitrate reductase subunit gamma [Gaiellaceae bacterium]
MNRADLFLWVALPYICLTIFVVGHVWRYRRDQLTWTARSTQLLEQRLLRVGSLLFHYGILAVIGGHVLGIVVPAGVTDRVGVDAHAYHRIAIVAGGTAGVAMTLGLLILLYRRAAVPRVRVTTSRGDLLLYPLLTVAIVTGMIATFGDNLLFGTYHYRETVSPWFRGIFMFSPQASLMEGAPFLFQLHATCVWLLYAVWPFSRLVHVWSIPLSYLQRSWILYRSRNPRAALAYERSRRAAADERAAR